MLFIIVPICYLTADAPGMIVAEVELITKDNVADTAFISLTWSDRMSIGKLGKLNSSTNLLSYLIKDEFSVKREYTTKVYKIDNLKQVPCYNFYFNGSKELTIAKDSPHAFSSELFFSSFSDIKKLDSDKYKSIFVRKYGHSLGDCSGIRKLSKEAITMLLKRETKNIAVINLECADILLVNSGKLSLDHLIVLGELYYNHKIKFNKIDDAEFRDEIEKILESKQDKSSDEFTEILTQFFIKKGVVVFVDQWD